MFDYLGTFTRSQWNVLKSFIIAEKLDISYRLTHLTALQTRLKSLREKLMLADNALGGTSLTGNAGDSSTVVSEGTTAAQALIKQLPNQSRYGASIPTVVGGDRPWQDEPISFNKLVISDQGIDDLSNGILVEDLKHWIYEQIKRRKEYIEYKLKKVNDAIEQIEYEKQLLTAIQVTTTSAYLESRIRTIEGRFMNPNYQNSSLFETAESFRTFPKLPAVASQTEIGLATKSQSVIDQETTSSVLKYNANVRKPSTKGYGRSGG